MAARFELKEAKNGKHYFNLLAANGEVILTSQMYVSRAGARKGIASVQANCQEAHAYERRTRKGGKCHFVLKAKNYRVIATSETYSAGAAMEKGIKSTMKNGIVDRVVAG